MAKQTNDNELQLPNKTAQRLYAEYAAEAPIIDFHCRLSAKDIALDRKWNSLTELWLNDSAKWRLMRTAGIDERFCTDTEIPDQERFTEWAKALDGALCNPLRNLSAMELKRAFGIEEPLTAASAKSIFEQCNALLSLPEYSTRGLLKRQNIKVVCTENDPVESLEYHSIAAASPFGIKVLPSWAPDKAMAVEDPVAFNAYVAKLSAVSGVEIHSFDDFIEALQVRYNFFGSLGCRTTIHRIEEFFVETCSPREIEGIFRKAARGRRRLSTDEIRKFRSTMMIELASMDWRASHTQIVYCGTKSDNNTRRYAQLGPNMGFDAVCDRPIIDGLSTWLDRLDSDNHLCNTIISNLNPRDTEIVAALASAFQDGRYCAAKVQVGLGSKLFSSRGDIAQRLNDIASTGLLGSFAGCASEAETVIGFSRHELFRRELCNFLSGMIDNGSLPDSELDAVGRMVENICAANAQNFFGI